MFRRALFLLALTGCAAAANYQTGREFAVPDFGEILRVYAARAPDARCDSLSLTGCLEILGRESKLECRERKPGVSRCEGPKLLFTGSGKAHASRGREWFEIRLLRERVVAADRVVQVIEWAAPGSADNPVHTECEAFGKQERAVCPTDMVADGALPPMAPRTIFSRRYSSHEMNDVGTTLLFLEACMRKSPDFRSHDEITYRRFRDRHSEFARYLAPDLERAVSRFAAKPPRESAGHAGGFKAFCADLALRIDTD
jgi:hypothetical protein